MGNPALNPPTLEDYLALEAQGEQKHEFWDGEIIAMTGASLVHNRLQISILRQLAGSVKQPCEFFGSDLRVRLPSNRYVYPDIVISCDTRIESQPGPDTLLNPCAVFEILSPSTENYDLTKKLAGYRQTPSIQDVLFVATEGSAHVQHYQRAEHFWTVRDLFLGDLINLLCGAQISVSAVYADITLAPESP